jgi:hypothetical protein
MPENIRLLLASLEAELDATLPSINALQQQRLRNELTQRQGDYVNSIAARVVEAISQLKRFRSIISCQ